MSQVQLNGDCACSIFQCLTIPEAITLSRTSHFWYEISSRRAAYRRMKFPSFTEEFDILEYRHWQEYDRQKLALTPGQLIQFSCSRVIANGITDLELILDESPFDLPHPANDPTTKLSMSTEEVLVTAISRYQSVVALTITISSNLGTVPFTPEIPWLCVCHLITHLASKLISFQVDVTFHIHGPFNFQLTHRLMTTHPQLTLPHLLHTRIPIMIDHHTVNDVRSATLRPFEPKGGLLELTTLFHDTGTGVTLAPLYCPSYYHAAWETLNQSLQEMADPPAHLIFIKQQYYETVASHSPTNRSLSLLLPQPRHPLKSPGTSVRDYLPVGCNYHEIGLTLKRTDEESDLFDLKPLRHVAHSLRSLNLEIDGYPDSNYHVLMTRLCDAADVWRSTISTNNSDSSSNSVSPFTQVRRIRIANPRHFQIFNGVEISLIYHLCPSLTHLELIDSTMFQDLVAHTSFTYHQLRRLTTSLPHAYHPSNGPNNEYMRNILSKFPQLESLHLSINASHTQDTLGHYLNLLVLSSHNLTEVILSCNPSAGWDAWLNHNHFQRENLNQWLIHLHLLWHVIQPTHQLPLEKMSLTPITCMVDLIPLLTTFLRHPFHQLPYLKHRCQEYDEKHSQPVVHQTNWFSRIATQFGSLITSRIHSFFRSTVSEATRAREAEELVHRQRLKLMDQLSFRSHDLHQWVSHNHSSQHHLQAARSIEPRPHFRIILQIEEARYG